MKLNAGQLREAKQEALTDTSTQIKRNPLYFILENIYDTYNVGGLFRLADALAVEKVYLCGSTETPPNARIQKSSIGTYKVVPWAYTDTAIQAIKQIKTELRDKSLELGRKKSQLSNPNSQIPLVVAVEQDERSVEYRQIEYSFPVVLVLGNETFGVLSETLAAVDAVAEIPMWGINKSLNVIVSAAIVGYHVVGAGR